jgi:hypothetical protein
MSSVTHQGSRGVAPAQKQPQPSALESRIQTKAEEAGNGVGAARQYGGLQYGGRHTGAQLGGPQVMQPLNTRGRQPTSQGAKSWEDVTGTKRSANLLKIGIKEH